MPGHLGGADGGGQGGAPRQLGRLAGLHGGHWMVLTGCRKGAVPSALHRRGPAAAGPSWTVVQAFGRDNVHVELWDHGDPLDSARNDALVRLADRARVEVVATNNVHYATPGRRRLATALAAVRARSSLADLDGWLPAGAGAHLRSGFEQAAGPYPGTVEPDPPSSAATWPSTWSWSPRLPDFPVPPGHTEMTWLRELAARGATRRYGPRGAERTPGAWRQIDYELADRAARLPRLLPDRLGHRRVLPPVGHLLPGPGLGGQLGRLLRDRDPPRPTPSPSACCSSASCPQSATGRPTSTWTSRPAAARRSSSTSTSGTAATGPPRWPT